jgi:hypothetical protein
MVLTGQTHVSVEQFSQTIASAYHQAVMLHFETMTGGGKLTNTAPKLPALYNGILSVCNMNRMQHNEVNFLQQIGPHIQAYWAGAIIIGPTGTATVLSPGSWTGIYIKQNYNFYILLNAMISCFRIHIMSLTGTYVSSVVPGVTSPWSGATLVSLG